MIRKKQVNIEFSSLTRKKDKELNLYYCHIKVLLTKIAEKNWEIHDGKNVVIINRAKQHIFKDTITKLILNLRDPDLYLWIIEYRTKLAQNLYRVFKKAKVYILILNAKL